MGGREQGKKSGGAKMRASATPRVLMVCQYTKSTSWIECRCHTPLGFSSNEST